MKFKKDRFVLRSKEAENKDRRLGKILTVTVLLSAIVLPLLNDGILNTLYSYVENDIALAFLDFVLRYVIVILQYAGRFISYAAVAVALVSFGYKKSKTAVLLFIIGGLVTYGIAQAGSWFYCYQNDLLSTADVTDVLVAASNYTILAVFEFVKNTVLVILCCALLKRLRKKADGELLIPDETNADSCKKPAEFFKLAFSGKNIFLRLCVFCTVLQALADAVVNFFVYTLSQLYTDGLPETADEYIRLLSSYGLIIPCCVMGFLLMTCACLYLSLGKAKPRI